MRREAVALALTLDATIAYIDDPEIDVEALTAGHCRRSVAMIIRIGGLRLPLDPEARLFFLVYPQQRP